MVSRDGAEIGTSPTVAFTDTSATPGTHAYVVAAEDAAHNRSGVSAPATATVPGSATPDPEAGVATRRAGGRAPPRTAMLRACASGASGAAAGRVSIRIRAMDAQGVASIELFIGRKRLKTVRLSSASSAGTLRYIGRLPRGARSAVARATDVSGNRSKVRFRLPR